MAASKVSDRYGDGNSGVNLQIPKLRFDYNDQSTEVSGIKSTGMRLGIY